jgi:hypothetical protein
VWALWGWPGLKARYDPLATTTQTVEEIRKGFSIMGEDMEFVLTFDPPLLVPAPAEDIRKALEEWE